jgi:hypothetical protein
MRDQRDAMRCRCAITDMRLAGVARRPLRDRVDATPRQMGDEPPRGGAHTSRSSPLCSSQVKLCRWLYFVVREKVQVQVLGRLAREPLTL